MQLSEAKLLQQSQESDKLKNERMRNITLKLHEAEEDCRQISYELPREKDARDIDAERYAAMEQKLRSKILTKRDILCFSVR